MGTRSATGALPPALQRMVETERAFARRAAVVGVRDAFLEYFADDSLQFTTRPEPYTPYLRQRPAVPPTVLELTWEPRYGDVAMSGELGYLTGPATRIVHGDTAQPPSYSCYFSIWKKQSDGTFKVFIDQGISTPGPATFDPTFTRADTASYIRMWARDDRGTWRVVIDIHAAS